MPRDEAPIREKQETPLSQNERQRKSRFAKDLVKFIVDDLQLNHSEDQLEVLALAMKRLNIHFKTAEQKPNRKGRPMTALHICQIVWDFWHSNSFQSTVTSRPAKLKIGKKPNTSITRLSGFS